MNFFIIILTSCAITISVVEDLRRQKIPNLVTFPTMFVALGYHVQAGGLNGLFFSLAGLGLGLVLFIIPYIMGGLGAGDVKLMMAVGAVLGPRGIVITSILVILVGGVYGLVLFILNPRYAVFFLRRIWLTLKTFVLTFQVILIPADTKITRPVLKYAVPIALGTAAYMLMQTTGFDLFPELLGPDFAMLSIAQGGQ